MILLYCLDENQIIDADKDLHVLRTPFLKEIIFV